MLLDYHGARLGAGWEAFLDLSVVYACIDAERMFTSYLDLG